MKDSIELIITVAIGVAVFAGALEMWFRMQGL